MSSTITSFKVLAVFIGCIALAWHWDMWKELFLTWFMIANYNLSKKI